MRKGRHHAHHLRPNRDLTFGVEPVKVSKGPTGKPAKKRRES